MNYSSTYMKILAGFDFENKGRLYKKMGLPYFKKFLPGGDYMFLLFRKMIKIPSLRNPEHRRAFYIFTIVAEFIHLIFFIYMNYIFLEKLIVDDVMNLKIILLNIIVNLLPWAVQRYNRLRITDNHIPH